MPLRSLPSLQPNTALNADWMLREQVGSGSQGTCWHVQHRSGQQALAKLFPIRIQQQQDPFRTAEREAEILGQLQHPGLPQFFDLLFLPEKRCMAVLREWIPGKNLHQEMDKKRFSEQDVLNLARS
ncbi:MAG: hypothetical protein AAGJ35_14570, partial [Myxococcota bacterium]